MDTTGAVDPWGGHPHKSEAVVPDFSKLGGREYLREALALRQIAVLVEKDLGTPASDGPDN